MCGCNKQVSTVSYNNTPIVDNKGICTVELDTLYFLQKQLNCLIAKQDFSRIQEREVLIGLGNINSMINLSQYCLFDVTIYLNLFTNYGCS